MPSQHGTKPALLQLGNTDITSEISRVVIELLHRVAAHRHADHWIPVRGPDNYHACLVGLRTGSPPPPPPRSIRPIVRLLPRSPRFMGTGPSSVIITTARKIVSEMGQDISVHDPGWRAKGDHRGIKVNPGERVSLLNKTTG